MARELKKVSLFELENTKMFFHSSISLQMNYAKYAECMTHLDLAEWHGDMGIWMCECIDRYNFFVDSSSICNFRSIRQTLLSWNLISSRWVVVGRPTPLTERCTCRQCFMSGFSFWNRNLKKTLYSSTFYATPYPTRHTESTFAKFEFQLFPSNKWQG